MDYNKTFWVHWDMSPEEIVEMTKKVINKSKKNNNRLVANNLMTTSDLHNFLSLLSDDISQLQIFHSMCGFLQYISPNEKVRKASSNSDFLLSEYSNELNMRKDLYDKIVLCKKKMEEKKLLKHIDIKFFNKLIYCYEKDGINLDKNKKELLVKIKHEIMKLGNFVSNYIRNIEEKVLEIPSFELSDIPDHIKINFEKKSSQIYKIRMSRQNYNICMKYIKNPKIRKNIEVTISNLDEKVTEYIVKLIVLRDKYAKLLSYNCYSDYKADDQMTKNSDNIKNFLIELLHKLDDRYKREIETISKINDNKNIYSYDLQYLVTKWKQEYGVNENTIKEYFELKSTIPKIFEIYEKLFDIKFVKMKKPKVWHYKVTMYSIVSSKSDIIGYLYLDLFTRNGKYKQIRCFCLQPGCMFPYNSEKYQIPIIALTTSFDYGDYILLNFQDVISIFHEMGHVMHHIFGQSKYIIFSGTNVETDFIETPAQVLDLICWEENIIRELSSHYITKQTLPDHIIKKLIKIKNIDIGLHYKKHIMIALFDQLIYSSESFIESCEKILKSNDNKQLKSLLSGLFFQLYNKIMTDSHGSLKYSIKMDQTSELIPHEWINTLFGLDSQYYCSIWSRVLASDLYYEKIKFKENNNLNNQVGIDLKNSILVHGGTKDPYDMICNYIGRKPAIDGFISMNNLGYEEELSFYQINNTNDYIDTVSNKFSEINESAFENCETENHEFNYLKKRFRGINY